MKFKTQHIRVAQGHNTYQLHRDGNVTWVTHGDGKDQATSDTIVHDSIRLAKAVFGDITASGK